MSRPRSGSSTPRLPPSSDFRENEEDDETQMEQCEQLIQWLQTSDNNRNKFLSLEDSIQRVSSNQRAAETWMTHFVDNGGVEQMLFALNNILKKYKESDVQLRDCLVQYQQCLRRLLAFPHFPQYVNDNANGDVTRLFTRALMSESEVAKGVVLMVLRRLLAEDPEAATTIVHEVFTEIAERTGSATFKHLVMDLYQLRDLEQLGRTVHFLNTYVGSGRTPAERMRLRAPLLQLGLVRVLNAVSVQLLAKADVPHNQRKSRDHLSAQVEQFTAELREDEVELMVLESTASDTDQYALATAQLEDRAGDKLDLLLSKLRRVSAETDAEQTERLVDRLLNVTDIALVNALHDNDDIFQRTGGGDTRGRSGGQIGTNRGSRGALTTQARTRAGGGGGGSTRSVKCDSNSSLADTRGYTPHRGITSTPPPVRTMSMVPGLLGPPPPPRKHDQCDLRPQEKARGSTLSRIATSGVARGAGNVLNVPASNVRRSSHGEEPPPSPITRRTDRAHSSLDKRRSWACTTAASPQPPVIGSPLSATKDQLLLPTQRSPVLSRRPAPATPSTGLARNAQHRASYHEDGRSSILPSRRRDFAQLLKNSATVDDEADQGRQAPTPPASHHGDC